MPYRIDYHKETDTDRKGSWFTSSLLTFAFFSLFLAAVSLLWPEGREVLRVLLIPGVPEKTLDAAEVFVSELDCGMHFTGAAADFFHKLTENAFSR